MSANTLTGLIPTIYRAADMVAREAIGFLPAVYINSDVEQVAKDQNITYPVVGAQTAADISPAATAGPNPSGQTVSTGTMTISKSRSVTFPWNGEEQTSINQIFQNTLEYQFQQAFRTLCNEMESDLFLAAKKGASRAYGTAGATPFGTLNDLSDFANIRKILVDNGCPMDDCHLVLNTTASTKILSVQATLFRANEAGTDALLRDAKLGRVQQLNLHESGQIVLHTKGTGTSYQLNGAHAKNVATLAVDTGSGTLLAGDVITIANGTPADSNKYVANSDLSAGSFTIGTPGLLSSHIDNDGVTIGNNYTGNFAFHRYALHLITRLPKMPIGGDIADDVITITDPFSGISFQVALYRQYRQVTYEVAAAWGTKAVKSDFIATLLG